MEILNEVNIDTCGKFIVQFNYNGAAQNMGRTKRIRLRRKNSPCLDHELEIINLRRWLSKNHWHNDTSLELRNFSETGRGVTSSKFVKENDVLIAVPYDVMITYTTLQTNLKEMISPSLGKLKMHDLLTIFLVIEKRKEKSLWSEYINSLPKDPPSLPWLATSDELNLYPVDLQIISRKKRADLEESMYRASRSIKKHPDCVLDENVFKWGYIMVNTRAVYVNPSLARYVDVDFLESVLADEPSMALCPFLDMFNHHFLAETKAELVYEEGRWIYQLTTLSKYKKFEQIFISYGAHDNITLLMDYGFFIRGNVYDTITFSMEEVLNTFEFILDEHRYKFIKSHNFDKKEDLYISYDGVSFNLKAMLFIGFNEQFRDYNFVIFSDSYSSEFLGQMSLWIYKLLSYKLHVFRTEFEQLAHCDFAKNDCALLMEDFLRYRLDFVQNLVKNLCYDVCAYLQTTESEKLKTSP